MLTVNDVHLTHELCWASCRVVQCFVQVLYHMHCEYLINLIRTAGAYSQSNAIWEYYMQNKESPSLHIFNLSLKEIHFYLWYCLKIHTQK